MGKLNELIPIIYKSFDKVNRGMPGMISSVYRDSSAEGVAIGQEIKFPVTSSKTPRDVVPGQNIPSYEGDAVGNRTLKITKQRATDIKWTGNELKSMMTLKQPILQDEFAQCMETLMSEVEKDMCLTAVSGGLEGGHVIGTAGTSPFASNLNYLTETYKTLQDAKAPLTDLHYVLNTEASMNLRNLTQLQKLNESGGSLLRDSEIGRLFKFNLAESNELVKHTKGAGSGYLVNNASGVPAGSKVVPVDTGSGVLKAGDIVTFSGGTEKYVVAKQLEGAGNLELTTGLLRQVDDNATITSENDYTPCIAFDRNALWLATRTIPNPDGGDSADDMQIVTDPVSGLSFMVSYYKEYHQERIEFALAWGTGIIKPSNIVTLLG